MFDLLLAYLIAGGVILLVAVGIFFGVNKPRPVGEVDQIDPKTGQPDTVVLWERGTRRSRWRGYCAIGGTLVGFWVVGVLHVVSAAQNGVTSVPAARWPRDICYSGAPMTAMLGFAAGLGLGAISSQFIPDRTRPPDPDAGESTPHPM